MVFTAEAARQQIAGAGVAMQYFIMGLVFQTFFFGLYTLLIWLSTRMLLARGLNTNVNRTMFGLTTFMYLLSAAYWAYNVADAFDRMTQLTAYAQNPDAPLPNHTAITQWSPVWNAITLINYVLSDGVVIWRAWIICLRNHRKYLWITIGFLAITAITVFLTIVFRIIGFVQSPIANLPTSSVITLGTDILQITTLFTSLLSNLAATGVVGATAVHHWRNIREAFSGEKRQTRSNQILLLVVESGAFYCFSAIIVLTSSLIRLPHGTLGDLYTPINVQIAGAYPCIVLLLVSTQRSLNESTFQDDNTYVESTSSRPPPVPPKAKSWTRESLDFAPNPALMPQSPFSAKARSSRLSDISLA